MAGFDPSARASDMEAMAPYWHKVETILGGLAAMKANAATYLPRFEGESDERYEMRVGMAKFTNVFGDITEDLASRAFAEKVGLESGGPAELEAFAEDVDAKGNNLHVFLAGWFYAGIAKGLDWVLVDYTKGVPMGATQAEEKELGARPYFVHYPAESVLAAFTKVIDGREQFVHCRFWEPFTEIVNGQEKTEERVRVIERLPLPDGKWSKPISTLWRKKAIATSSLGVEWEEIEGERLTMTLDEIPLVPFRTGRRLKGWKMTPPMEGAADLQVTLFQQESDLEYAKRMSAYPMLVGVNITPEMDKSGAAKPVTVGPMRILYAPPPPGGGSADWHIIEPSATSLEFLGNSIKETTRELRELGRQPLTAASGNLTVITTAYAANKGNSAVQAWAQGLKDAAERAMGFVCQWLRLQAKPVVQLDLDFDTSTGQDDGFGHVLALRAAGEISRETALHEAKRRNILDRDFDPDADLEQMLEEMATEAELAPDTGTGTDGDPAAGQTNPPPQQDGTTQGAA